MQNSSWLRKAVGGGLGLMIAGPLGAVLGTYAAGHLKNRRRARSADPLLQARETFFTTTFSLMGHIGQRNGQISAHAFAVARQIMTRMELDPQHRRTALAELERGAAPAFDADRQISAFLRDCAAQRMLRHMLLVFLCNMAVADGPLTARQYRMLRHVATRTGLPEHAFAQMMRMIAPEPHFNHGGNDALHGEDTLAEAYDALGIRESASDQETRRAYRRLMSQHHPDKLIAEGVAQDRIRRATQRSQEIQTAWEQVRRARGI